MAKRFGGTYSPDGATDPRETEARPFEGKTADVSTARTNAIFPVAIVLVATTFSDGALALLLGLGGAAAIVLSAWLAREGILAEAAYNARKIARRPALPRKMLAAVSAGIGVALGVMAHQNGILPAVIFGGLTSVLFGVSFGIDPMRDKGMTGVDRMANERVARAVENAERHLSDMSDAILRAGDKKLEARVESFQSKARAMFRRVEDDPRDLTAARKYMGVYLLGAKDATAKFADLYQRTKDPKVRQDYVDLLSDLEVNFTARSEQLLLDDRSDLDVEIEVLRDRLRRDGLRAE